MAADHAEPPLKRRCVEAFPQQLLEQCAVCFEEKLYSQALSLLSSCLTAGADTAAPAYVPPAQYLALSATLSVHPNLTTRTEDQELQAAAGEALEYLRHVVRTLDIKSASIREAFRFTGGAATERSERARIRKSQTAGEGENEGDQSSALRSKYADKLSLWNSAEDFWAVLGWAFNCSVRYKARWEWWKPWLETILDALGADMESSAGTNEVDMRHTLIAQYLVTAGEGRLNKRRVMRAITADGSTKSLNEFGEVFRRETSATKKEQNGEDMPIKRQKLDLDNGEFGDYYDNESEEEDQGGKDLQLQSTTTGATRTRRSNSAAQVTLGGGKEDEDCELQSVSSLDTPGSEVLGGMDSIRLRQRILGLLARLSRTRAVPRLLIDPGELVELFAEFLLHQSLPTFQQFISPLTPYLDSDLQEFLNATMFQSLVGCECSATTMSPAEFESTIAPATAGNTTIMDNTRVSLLVEAFLRTLWRSNAIHGDMRNLRATVEAGIQARDAKAAPDGRVKSENRLRSYEAGRISLQCSADRLRTILDVAEQLTGSSSYIEGEGEQREGQRRD